MDQSEISNGGTSPESGVPGSFVHIYASKVLILLHVLFWTLIPALAQRNAPIDVVEGFAWGREWLLGTYKHPPLQSWLLEIVWTIFGSSAVGYFGLAALCGGIALWAVYKTAGLLTDNTTALVATALTESILYFTFLSTEFNPNSLQVMLWALAGFAFAGAVVLKTTRYWIALGFIFAAGFYSKYFMAVCGISYALYLLKERDSRRWFARPQPYVALILCAILCLPHLVWLHQNDYLPFHYAESRLYQTNEISGSIKAALAFAGAQAAALLPPVLLGGFLVLPFKAARNKYQSLIRWLAFAPIVLIMVPSIAMGQGLRSMWGFPILTFIPLWLVMEFRINTARLKYFTVSWAVVFGLVLISFAGRQMFASELGIKPTRGNYPGHDMARYFDRVWQGYTNKPLYYVVGDQWEVCNVALYSSARPRPHVWFYGGRDVNPWITDADVLKQGAVIIWKAEESKPPEWVDIFLSRFPGTVVQPNHSFAYTVNKSPPTITVGFAILPPKP